MDVVLTVAVTPTVGGGSGVTEGVLDGDADTASVPVGVDVSPVAVPVAVPVGVLLEVAVVSGAVGVPVGLGFTVADCAGGVAVIGVSDEPGMTLAVGSIAGVSLLGDGAEGAGESEAPTAIWPRGNALKSKSPTSDRAPAGLNRGTLTPSS